MWRHPQLPFFHRAWSGLRGLERDVRWLRLGCGLDLRPIVFRTWVVRYSPLVLIACKVVTLSTTPSEGLNIRDILILIIDLRHPTILSLPARHLWCFLLKNTVLDEHLS